MVNLTQSQCPINLGDLLGGIAAIKPTLAQRQVAGIALDHRQLQNDWVFVALGSENDDRQSHGLQHLKAAKAKQKHKMSAVLLDSNDKDMQNWDGNMTREAGVGLDDTIAEAPLIFIDDLRAKLPLLGDRVYDSAGCRWLGITGTNGKSSIAHLLCQALNNLGEKCAVIGGVYNGFADLPATRAAAGLTTPDGLTLRRHAAGFKRQGAVYVALECSSHGLDQHRADGLDICGAVFTNLTPEHGDYHKDFKSYEESKRRLFEFPSLQFGVINYDDPVGRKWLSEGIAAKGKLNLLSYSIAAKSQADKDGPDLLATELKLSRDACVAKVRTAKHGSGELKISTPSVWALSNAAACLAVLLQLGHELKSATAAIAQAKPLAGRMQKLASKTAADFIVDYAHTPVALNETLKSARQQLGEKAKLWLVFGCGGERDQDKRKLMGEVADKYADEVILTNDNPRAEDPAKIIDDIKRGFSSKTPQVEPQRSAALDLAIASAAPHDLVLVAGKGHESHQEIKGEFFPFNDYDYLNSRLKQETGGSKR